MRRPNFLVVGTARAGTTALHYQLRNHPGLFLPRQKEPCFFCFEGKELNYKYGSFSFAETDPRKYFNLFEDAGKKIAGEISTPYLYLHKQSIASIQKHYYGYDLPKIIMLLRDPVDRAYSHYLMKVREGREKLSFREAIDAEQSRVAENYSIDYHYGQRSLYAEAVRNYLSNFPFVKIILFEEFIANFSHTMKGILNFLGAEEDFHFTDKGKINSGSIPRNKYLGKLVTSENKIKFKMLSYLPDNLRLKVKEQFNRMNASAEKQKPLSAGDILYMKNIYRADVLELEKVAGLKLNHWLT